MRVAVHTPCHSLLPASGGCSPAIVMWLCPGVPAYHVWQTASRRWPSTPQVYIMLVVSCAGSAATAWTTGSWCSTTTWHPGACCAAHHTAGLASLQLQLPAGLGFMDLQGYPQGCMLGGCFACLLHHASCHDASVMVSLCIMCLRRCMGKAVGCAALCCHGSAVPALLLLQGVSAERLLRCG